MPTRTSSIHLPPTSIAATEQPETPVLIRAARLWDGVSGTAIPHGGILFQAGQILDVGPAADLPRPDGVIEADYPHATLMPGLIDCHSHLNFRGDGSSIEDMMLDSDLILMTIGAENLRKALASGVTTLCDNGARGQTALNLRTSLEKATSRVPAS